MPAARDKSAKQSASLPVPEDDGLRMRDLVRLTGLPRETIHFYLAQGLLPKALKTGRNTATYGPEHLDRLQRIKELQDRHFLPLRAIKAVLEEGAGGGFSEEQEAMLRRVRESVPAGSLRKADADVALSEIVPSKVSRADLDAIRHLGIVDVNGSGSRATISAEDARLLDDWAELRALLRPDEPQITPEMLGLYDDAMDALVAREARTLTQRFTALSGERTLELIEAADPLILRVLAALRRKKIATLLQNATPAASDDPT